MRNVKREDLQDLSKLDLIILIVDELIINNGYKANINEVFERIAPNTFKIL